MPRARRKLTTMLWRFVHRSGLAALARRRHRDQLLVVTYHGVLRETNGSFLRRNCVSVERFRRQLAYLRRHWRLLDVEQALEAVAGAGLPRASALVTFDDGFRNNHDVALPVLEAARAPAVVFVATGMLDDPGTVPWVEQVPAMILRGGAERLSLRTQSATFDLELRSAAERERACDEIRGYMQLARSDERNHLLEQLRAQTPVPASSYEPERYAFLTWAEARRMAEHGVAIGSHTVRHLCLASLSESELREEVSISKQRIEEETGRPCIAHAYPDGTPDAFGERDRRVLRELGFRGAFTQIAGLNAPGSTDPFAIRRYNVPGGAASFASFVATITGARELAHRVRA